MYILRVRNQRNQTVYINRCYPQEGEMGFMFTTSKDMASSFPTDEAVKILKYLRVRKGRPYELEKV